MPYMTSEHDDIAIVGMSCRVAGADSPSKLWDVLASSKDVQSEITRFDIGGFYKPDGGPRKGMTNVREAYFIDDGIDRFDNGFFSIPPLEATAMDPQQRLLLELTYEAVENAGIPLENFQGTNTAVYTGIFGNDYATSLLRDIDMTPKYHSTGTSNAIAANRISYFFDLHGPSLSIDTACSSTMACLHQAVLALRAKDANMAVVAGSNLIINPDMFVHMSELGFLSPTGRCKSFDADGDGYARGEGVLAIVLKPLEQALKHGDPVRAVIKASRVNQDGRTQGITLPSSDAQKRNLDSLYTSSELDPRDVQYLEAHGTGTAAGDPLEMSAIDSVFSESRVDDKLVVGSIKSNIGHLESCAALAGIIKTVECLERGQIPPQMHFKKPNPKINYHHIEIPTSLMDWPRNGKGIRRAAVNSFGFGGTNGHVVLDHFPPKPRELGPIDRPFLFKVSAMNSSLLEAMAEAYADYVESEKPHLLDLSHTLLSRRSTMKKSRFFTASTQEELVEKLRSSSSTALTRSNESATKVGFLFTGQGAQWPQMGKELLERSDLFRAIINECDRILATVPDGPSWKIAEELSKPKETSHVNQSSFSQPLCTALQLGLVEILKSWGVTPEAVVGHSSGEIGAAYCAGILSLRDAIITAYYRGLYLGSGLVTDEPAPKGAMCAVGMSESDSLELLASYTGRVALAAVNSPSSCTLSGDEDAIKEIVDACAARGTFCRALKVDMAYHSHHMLAKAPKYEEALRSSGVSPLTASTNTGCEMFSSVTQNKLSPSNCFPEYWKDNMVSTVRFTAALSEAMRSHDLTAIVELGPHPALKGPANDTLAALGITEVCYFTSCLRGKPDFVSLLDSIGEMVNAGVPVDCTRVNGLEIVKGLECHHEFGRVLTDVPKYVWDHSNTYWGETRMSHNQRFRSFPRHEMLGARNSNDNPLSLTWRNQWMLKEVKWLADLKNEGARFVSASAFVLMAFEAARQVHAAENIGEPFLRLSDVRFMEPMLLSTFENEETIVETHFILHRAQRNDSFGFEIFAVGTEPHGTWTKHCTGNFAFARSQSALPSKDPLSHDPEKLEYVKSFNTLTPFKLDDFRLDENRASGQFEDTLKDHESYRVHPSVFASIMQIPEALMLASGLPATYRLHSIETVEMPLGLWKFQSASCESELTRIGPTQGSTELQVWENETRYIYFQGIHSELDQQIHRKPPLKSLFFTPKLNPDITHIASSSQLAVSRILELVTHKWPMSDIGMLDVEPPTVSAITSYLHGTSPHERPRFRSLNIVGETGTAGIDRIRIDKKLDENVKLHLLFGSASRLRDFGGRIHPRGLVCARLDGSEDENAFRDTFDRICDVAGFPGEQWLLGRPNVLQNGVSSQRKLMLITLPGFNITSLEQFLDFEHTELDDTTIESLSSNFESAEQFDLIFMDSGDGSILTKWAGGDFLPWLQRIIERVSNLLWVTDQKLADPFAGVAGSFVRTIQAEQPLMKAANLLLRDESDPHVAAKLVHDTYNAMTHGDREIELVAQRHHIHVLRYHPDDELAASVGAYPPIELQKGLSSRNYQLSLAGVKHPLILSNRSDITFLPSMGIVQIFVEASVLDDADVVKYMGSHFVQHTWDGLGQFFAGRVASEGDPIFVPSTLVVGWHSGAHRSTLEVSTSHLRLVPGGTTPSEAASHYAAYATAFAVVEGTARARPYESLEIRVSGILAEALKRVCQFFGVIYEPESAIKSDFVVTFDSSRGLLVNDRPVSVATYMMSNLHCSSMNKLLEEYSDLDDSVTRSNLTGRQTAFQESLSVGNNRASYSKETTMNRLLVSKTNLKTTITSYELPDVQRAFQEAQRNPLSTVLVHTGLEKVEENLLTYVPPKQIFRGDGAYIIIGGLGGLGRYLSTWMIAHGATYLVTLSRSGLRSENAQAAVKAINDLGGHIDVIEADASDRGAVDAALASVRDHQRIRGCLNLAMILDDASIMTMTGKQWDRALRVKVDTTWNLHQSTLSDELDFFIMFSSISSICGNRTQANYSTGNAFQNAVAEYRRSQGLPGIAIALGAMSGIGVLAEDQDLLRTFSQSGLTHVKPEELTKILEAALLESRHRDRSLISTGFEMFETLDGNVQSRADQTQIFWMDWPEFGFLFDHKFSTGADSKDVSVSDQLQNAEGEAAHAILLEAFLGCLSSVLGYEVEALDPTSPIASYGLDSLNAVSCRYWFFKQLSIDVTVFDILGCKSINDLISRVLGKLGENTDAATAIAVPQPLHYADPSERPLSHSQRRLWFLNKFLEDKTVYNLLLVCHIVGKVDVELLRKTWSVLMQRHEILRSKIVDTNDGLKQIPIPDVLFPLTEIESSENSFDDQVSAITQEARSYEFDLEAGELVHGWLLKSPREWRFFLGSHHLAWDRASVPTIFEETSAISKSLVAGKDAEDSLSPVPYQFLDYTLWQEKFLNEQSLVDPLVNYWKKQLEGIPESVSLFPMALTHKRPAMKQNDVDVVRLELDAELTKAIKSFCAERAVTPFMFMASAVSALIHRLTGDEDVVLGITDGDRGHSEFDRLVGFTVNMLAIRSKIHRDAPYTDLLEEYRKSCLEAYEHRSIPFDYLLQRLEVPRRTSHNPVFQVIVNYQMQGAFPEYDYGDFKFSAYDHYNAKTQSDFTLDIEETVGGELHCVFGFDTALYDKETMSDVTNTYKLLIENVIATKGEANVDKIKLISNEEQQFISSKLDASSDTDQTIAELDRSLFPTLFLDAVKKHPTKSAIMDEKKTLTYLELDVESNRVANFLLSQGAQVGDRIGLFSEQSIEMVIAMYGIVKAGCAYVPIDPDFPEERISSMIEDVELGTVFVHGMSDEKTQRLISCGLRISQIHEIGKIVTSNDNVDSPVLSRQLQAYDSFCCIFTSGSTGRPKGIYIGHGQLRYQMKGYNEYINTVHDDRILLASAMVFDLSLPAIFGTILYGATMFVASREARFSPALMLDYVVDNKITNCVFTPTQVKVLFSAPNKVKLQQWKCLRSLVLGGESIPPWLVRDFYTLGLPEAVLYNGYAPAETTVVNSLRRLTPDDAKRQEIPVDSPIYPARFYILDGDLNAVPVGSAGELFIGGPMVNRGYVNRPEATEKAFIQDPFAPVAEIEAGNGKMYRTGDSFRLSRDGTVHCIGRIEGDRQVKIRGMRTELAEIENAIWDAYQGLEEEDVPPLSLVAVAYYKEAENDGLLSAYLTTTDGAKISDEQHQTITAFVGLELEASLPVHMRPSAFVFLPDLPRTVTGKVDYKTILTWPPPTQHVRRITKASGEETELNEVQQTIASVWKDVLSFDQGLAPADDFFSLGGNSLLLMHVQAGVVERCGATLSLADMFAHPTISGMERLIQANPEYRGGQHVLSNGINGHAGDLVNGHAEDLVNGHAEDLVDGHSAEQESDNLIDWEKEGSLPEDFDWFCTTDTIKVSPSAIAMTGACTITGVHFLHHILTTTSLTIYCLSTDAESEKLARSRVVDSLKHFRLDDDVDPKAYERMIVYKGTLAHPTLGLSPAQVSHLDSSVHAIYHLDSDVSLLKNYESIRAGNVGSLQFLISLAHGSVNNTKAIHYLSTWGVPHLQAWTATSLSKPGTWVTAEEEMKHMTPGADSTLGYLKCRWACESLLGQAARRGVPVSIFRGCMTASSPRSGVALPRTDINRRILSGSLATGLVPDFASAQGGGMSWVTADFLAESITFLSLHAHHHSTTRSKKPAPRIYHVVSPTHVPYTELPSLLHSSRDSSSEEGPTQLTSASPAEWFAALRALRDPEAGMQAEVLEKWCDAGWVPFGLDAGETLRVLKEEGGIEPRVLDGLDMMRLVVGEEGF